jgi:hypothetical protein
MATAIFDFIDRSFNKPKTQKGGFAGRPSF